MPSETTTPNIGLQVPAFNQANWQVPLNYNLNLLDLIFGGTVQVPALSAVNLAVVNGGAVLAPSFIAEAPTGSVPGTTYALSHTPALLLAVFVNGIFQQPGLHYTSAGGAITFTYTTSSGDLVYALYFK